jgi:hypothetical protein
MFPPQGYRREHLIRFARKENWEDISIYYLVNKNAGNNMLAAQV